MSITCGNCERSHGSVEEVRECHGLFPNVPAPATPIPVVASCDPSKYPEPMLGTFTMVYGDDEWRTFEVKPWKSRPGMFIISLLIGPNNDRDFLGFGEWGDGQYRMWKRNAHNEDMQGIIGWLKMSDEDKFRAAGEVYAMQSGRCCRCGRKLTVPASLNRGMGPECAGKI